MDTTVKQALTKWQEKTGQKTSEAKEIELFYQIPAIGTMDSSLSSLTSCEKLSLSTNCIEKITNLDGLKNLKILSLSRNYIKTFDGLEAVGDTLEQLWISYNLIENLTGVNVMKKLKLLYMSNNLVKTWAEFEKLAGLPCLVNLLFVKNPLEKEHTQRKDWRIEASKRLPNLRKLDGEVVIREKLEQEE